MTGLEVWLLAIGLAMDCFAVSIASGIILKRIQWRPMFVMALFFGVFQALMPLLGWTGASIQSPYRKCRPLDSLCHSCFSGWAYGAGIF